MPVRMRKTPATESAGVMRGGRGKDSPELWSVLVALLAAFVGEAGAGVIEVFASCTEVDGPSDTVDGALPSIVEALDASEGAGAVEEAEEEGSEDCELSRV